MATRMQQRRGTAAQWTAANPVLAAGEIGFETDTSRFKMGNGSSAWGSLTYFANTAELTSLLDGAPDALNTLNELAAAIGDDANFIGTFTSHANDTTGVHGIADTAALATTAATNLAIAAAASTANANLLDAIDAASDTAQFYATQAKEQAISAAAADATSKAATAKSEAIEAATTTAAQASGTALATHTEDTTNVHGIADTSLLATKQYADGAATTASSAAQQAAVLSATALIATAKTEAISEAGSGADTKISNHNLDSTNVHGIADTADLVTFTDLTNAIDGAEVNQSLLAGTGLFWNGTDTQFEVDEAHITTATQTALDLKAPLANPTFTGTVAGVTKAHVGLGNVSNTADADKPVSTATQTALDTKLNLSGGTLTGALTLSGAPTSDLHAATKQYVDGLAAGINFHQPVLAATAGNLAGTYSNGTNGIGATITAASNGSIGTIDGVSVSVGNRILLRAQTDAKQNGVYTVTAVGSAGAPWVVTRAADADNNPAGELATGDFVFVTSGSTNGSKGFILSTTGTITIGTTEVSYAQFNASEAVVAGTNITRNGATIAVADAPTFSGAVTASSGIVFSDGTQTKVGVPSITTFATAISSSATLASGEQDKFVPLTGAVTITLPATGYSTGQSIDFYQASGTGAQFSNANSTVGTPGLKFRTTNSVVTAMKTSSGWLVFGDLSA
jgi:hypothetical protein